VEVITQKSQNIIREMTVDGSSVFNKKVRGVSIDKFYKLVTGDKIALKQLCKQLPTI